jgi:hypothetical protein
MVHGAPMIRATVESRMGAQLIAPVFKIPWCPGVPVRPATVPLIAGSMGELQFGAIQAVTVAALGQSLHAALYG